MHEAKTHLFRLVEAAANGEPFIIARAGKPAVKVMAVDAPDAGAARRLGFLSGQIAVPEDFDRMGSARSRRVSKSSGEPSHPIDLALCKARLLV